MDHQDNTANDIQLKSISDVLGINFYIPEYQRSYPNRLFPMRKEYQSILHLSPLYSIVGSNVDFESEIKSRDRTILLVQLF